MNIIPSSGKKKLPSANFYCAVFDMHEKSPEKNMANVTPPPPLRKTKSVTSDKVM